MIYTTNKYTLDGRHCAILVDSGARDKGSAIAIDVWSPFMPFEMRASKINNLYHIGDIHSLQYMEIPKISSEFWRILNIKALEWRKTVRKYLWEPTENQDTTKTMGENYGCVLEP